MSYTVTSNGSVAFDASGTGAGGYNVSATIRVEASTNGSTLNYKMTSYTSNYPYMDVRLYVNGGLVYDSGYVKTNSSAWPRGNGTSYSGSCAIPSEGNVTIRVIVGISKEDGSQADNSGVIYRTTTTYHTVTFANGLGAILKTQDIVHGSSATPPANPSRMGYTFAGWNGSYSNVTGDKTITATWSVITYPVIYDGNGGVGVPAVQTKTYGTNINLSTTIPTRKGYKFLGWGTNAGTIDIVYLPGAVYSNNATITLYAIWKKVNNMALSSGGQIKKGKPWLNGQSGTPWIKIKGIWKKGE